MAHLKTKKAQRGFIYKKVSEANAEEVEKIYKATEKATNFYKKKK